MIVREAKPATAALGARRSSPVWLVQVRRRIRKPTRIQRGLDGDCLRSQFVVCVGGMSDWRIAGPATHSEGKKIVEMKGRSAVGYRDEANNDE